MLEKDSRGRFTTNRYDDYFKRKVIIEYLSTGCSKMALIRKYNISFKSAIQYWMKELGYTDPYRGIRYRFAGTIENALPKKPQVEPNEDIQKKIKELEPRSP